MKRTKQPYARVVKIFPIFYVTCRVCLIDFKWEFGWKITNSYGYEYIYCSSCAPTKKDANDKCGLIV